MSIKEQIKIKFEEALIKSGLGDEEIIIERPKNKINGDFSCNIAMVLARKRKNNPIIIAQKIVELIDRNKIIKEIKIEKPGFINIFIEKEILLLEINNILEEEDNYGKNNYGKNKKVNVEFVSANPTGVLHVGTARGAAYGDNLCRLLSFSGYDVTREYYINDCGNQIKKLGMSLRERYKEVCDIEFLMPEEGYYGEEIKKIAEKIYNNHKEEKLEEEDIYFEEYAIKELLKQIEQDLKDFRVEFDIWTSEKNIRKSGKIEKSLKILEEKGNIYNKEGAIWLKTSKYGDNKDRVIVKKDGEYTYLVPDIAYHLDKIERKYDILINILGTDHHGYIPRLKASLEALGIKEQIEIKLLQMVRLIENGKEIKMSKRTGKTITIKELIEEIGVDTSRYFFASRTLDTMMDFDLTLAKEQTKENPVYYIQYAHARICSIINKEKQIKIEKYTTLESEESFELLKKINEFKEIIEEAAKKQLPNLIANYVLELATLFHIYYTNEKIIDNKKLVYTKERINLIKSIKIIIKNSLNLLGIEALEKM